MKPKITRLTNQQADYFKNYLTEMGTFSNLIKPASYPAELINCDVNPRGTVNPIVGYEVVQHSGSQLAIQTTFYDPKDRQDNTDLHIVNFASKEIASYYRGWGTWTEHYGDNHWGNKDYLRSGTVNF